MDVTESDEALLVACRQGQRDAFARLVERYQDLVCAVTYSATGSRALSEDIAQDTFLAAWRRLPELRSTDRLRPWLCSIARNLGRNARRDHARELSTDTVPELPDDPGVLDALGEREQEALVWQALSEMPESYREPLVLYYREGKSAADVAAALGVSINAAEQRLSRGRRQLKQNVAAFVERSLSRSRPPVGIVAAVLTALGAETIVPSTASAATGAAANAPTSSTLTGAMLMAIAWKTLIIGSVATALTHACVTWSEHGRADDDDDISTEVAGTRGPAKAAARPSIAEHGLTDRDRDRTSRDEGPPPRLPKYQLTLSPNLAAVALEGGSSEVTSAAADEPVPPPIRSVSGRVVGQGGEPVAGAVVIAGQYLSAAFGNHLTSQRGATTDEHGQFEVQMPHDKRVVVVALHETGWSPLTFVEPGTIDRRIDVEIGPPARFEGSLRRDGAPIRANIQLQELDKALTAQVEGGDDGHFTIPALPPGKYTAYLRVAAGVDDTAVESTLVEEIELVAGETATWNASIDAGPTIAILARVPSDLAFEDIQYVKLVGGRTPATLAELEARSPKTNWVRRFTSDSSEAMEFRDVQRGKTSFCIRVRDAARTPVGFGCTSIDVRSSPEVQELEVAVRPLGEAD